MLRSSKMDAEEIRNWKKVKVLKLLRRNPMGMTRDQLRIALHYNSRSTLVDTIKELVSEKLVRVMPGIPGTALMERIILITEVGE